MSQFREIAKSISVEEICKPFIATFNVDDLTISVYEKWAIELCYEKD
ncbi:MAG: hypothetical protein IPP06_05310 [Saprospiraceae bacterium]|nr:hypothetical protein [Candidatus Vicinibacter affinis]